MASDVEQAWNAGRHDGGRGGEVQDRHQASKDARVACAARAERATLAGAESEALAVEQTDN